jgi:hypothetical protein
MLPVGSSKAAYEANPNAGYPGEAGSAGDDRSLGCTGRARGPLSAADASALAASTLASDALGVGLGSAALMLLLAVLTVRHFATTSWPLSHGQPGLLVAAGLLLLLAQALKALGWARLFTNRERPSPVALVAGNGGAALIVVLPGHFDDAMRIAVVRRYPGCPAGLRAISLSLVMLGLIDSAALVPLAAVAVAFPGAGVAARAALAVVAGAGIAAAAVLVALPRLAGSKRALRFRLGRWLSPRTTSLYHAMQAWAFVFGCWLVRGVACFIMLGTLGLGYSFPLALLFLCAGAAAAALPIGPAGAATQVGRRNRRSRRLGCRNIASACCLCLRWCPGSLLRGSRPALRRWVAHRRVAPVRSDPARSGRGGESVAVSIAYLMWDSSRAFL